MYRSRWRRIASFLRIRSLLTPRTSSNERRWKSPALAESAKQRDDSGTTESRGSDVSTTNDLLFSNPFNPRPRRRGDLFSIERRLPFLFPSLATFGRGPESLPHYLDDHGESKPTGESVEKSIVKNLAKPSRRRGRIVRISRNYSKFEVARRSRLAFFIEFVTRRPTDLLLGNNSEPSMNLSKHGRSPVHRNENCFLPRVRTRKSGRETLTTRAIYVIFIIDTFVDLYEGPDRPSMHGNDVNRYRFGGRSIESSRFNIPIRYSSMLYFNREHRIDGNKMYKLSVRDCDKSANPRL